MTLVGNQRGGAYDLATHLLKDEKKHVEVHELRGFMSNDLHSAFQETYAISKATKCRQYFFSLSLNPPPDVEVPTQDFENAIDRIENKLGLDGQPRAVVFHEKEGGDGLVRRHAHAVWSRIDPVEMKAKQLFFDRNRMQEVSRELYLEHGWKMPEGLSKSGQADPRNYTLEQWQQVKRHDKHPNEITTALQDAWAISDNKVAFTHALEERGYRLARGDKRGFLAVNTNGKHYSLSRWSKVKPKELSARLGDESKLPNLEQTKATIAKDLVSLMDSFNAELKKKEQARKEAQQKEKHAMTAKQRQQRAEQRQMLEARQQTEAIKRQARFRKGYKGLWDRVSGEHKHIRERNEMDACHATKRDQAKRDELIFRHMERRKRLALTTKQEQAQFRQQKQEITEDRKTIEKIKTTPAPARKPVRRRKGKEPESTPPPEPNISPNFNCPPSGPMEPKLVIA